MSTQESYLIGELAQLAGVTPRTIRYYTAEGLLPPPDARGRYARYGAGHLRRLRLIERLKADYLPLGVIRERLDTMGEAEAGRLLEIPGAVPQQSSPGESPALLPRLGQAAGYAVPEGPRMAVREAHDPFRLTPAPLQTGRVEFFADSPELIGGEAAGAATRWQRIALAPGVELHVREPLSPSKRRRIDELVAGLRDTLATEDD